LSSMAPLESLSAVWLCAALLMVERSVSMFSLVTSCFFDLVNYFFCQILHLLIDVCRYVTENALEILLALTGEAVGLTVVLYAFSVAAAGLLLCGCAGTLCFKIRVL
jgi:hypothetical protein